MKTPENSSLGEPPKFFTVFEIVVAQIVLTSTVSIAALFAQGFSATPCLAVATLLNLALWTLWRKRLRWARLDLWVLPILAVAAFLRVKPYNWIMGGQDQGIYMNMAGHVGRAGTFFVQDSVREKLSPELQKIYDLYNQRNVYPDDMFVPHKAEGTHVPGVYVSSLQDSRYVFQFYPLHPIWMAHVGKILGNHRASYSLLFFSLLSLCALYALTLELSGGSLFAARTALFLVALNPLHAFFSKFPLSEINSVAFSLLGFLYLLRFRRSQNEGRQELGFLALSAGLFGCLFFNHISGFLYWPFLVLLLGAFVLVTPSGRRPYYLYFASLLALFVASLVYGYLDSFPYFRTVYASSFEPLFGDHWKLILLGFSLLLIAGFVLLERHRQKVMVYVPALSRLMAASLAVAASLLTALALYKAYELGFTHKYDLTPVHTLYDLSGHGWSSFYSSTFVSLLLFLNPLAAVIWLSVFWIQWNRKLSSMHFLLAFCILFWGARVLGEPVTGYKYYYARYLLGELLPCALIIVALALAQFAKIHRCTRWVAGLAVAAMGAMSFWLTKPQLQGREADGVEQANIELLKDVGSKDLILYPNEDSRARFTTTQAYFYGMNVAYLPLTRADWSSLYEQYDRIFLFSTLPVTCLGDAPFEKIPYREGMFEHTQKIPSKFLYVDDVEIFKYEIPKKDLKGLRFSNLCLHALEADRINFSGDGWSDGHGILKGVGYPIQARDKFLGLAPDWAGPIHTDLKNSLQLKLFANGTTELPLEREVHGVFYFAIPRGLTLIQNLDIRSATFVPKEVNPASDDPRHLGIRIKHMDMVTQIPKV